MYLKDINNQLENEFDQKLGFESRRVYIHIYHALYKH